MDDGIDQNCVNDAPTMDIIANQSTYEDISKAVTITVRDVDNVLTCSTGNITVTSTNASLITPENVVF